MADPEVRPAAPLRPVPDATALAERRARRAELAERAQAGRADAAEALAAELSVRLARLEAQLARGDTPPSGRVGELEVELRRAWQQAFAEQKRREEIEEASHRREEALRAESERLRAELSRAQERVEELRLRVRALEREAEAVRWRDEEQAEPAADSVGDPEPEEPAVALTRPVLDRVEGLRREAELARTHLDLGPVPGAPDPDAALPATREMSVVVLPPEVEPARAEPVAPPEPHGEPVAAPEPPAPPAPAPDAFDAARARLQSSAPTPEPVALPRRRTGEAWVGKALGRLARSDPERAGEILLALAPAHHLASPGPLVYRIEVPGHTTLDVVVAGGRTRVGDATAVPEVTVEADLPALAAHLTRKGARRHRARVQVHGPRRRRKALRSLGRIPVRLADLHEAGV